MIRFFIHRPIFAAVVSIVITLVGVISILNLPIAQYPEISPPTVSVSATYTGANAEVVADTVATPIEQQINGAEDMLYMSSISANDGSMSLSVTFDIGRDLDLATVDVQNRLSLANPQLPEDVTRSGVTVLKQSPDILAVVSLTSPGGEYDSLFLTNYASINIADALARIKGVGNVQVFGAGDYSMRIWLDPGKMADLGLTVSDIANAINEQNVQAPAGQIGMPPVPEGQVFQYAVQVKGRLSNADEFLNIVLRSNPDGSMVRIKDVGSVELGSLSYNNFSRLNGQDTCSILIYQLPGANALETVKEVRATMEQLAVQFPSGVSYSVPYDTTLFVNASIQEVMQTLYEALFLVLLVVFVFLQNWRATLIPMVTVPVSLVGTFLFFTLLDFSINTLSLFGIVLAIGLVVDDAIVVVEAVQRIMDEEGLSPKEATIKAMDEVSGAIIGTSLVLIAVFVPVAFMGGITGRLYQQFALTLAVSVAISTLNALTLSPALCSLLLKPKYKARGPLGWFFDKFNAIFEWVTRGYLAGVRGAMRMALLTLAVLGVLIFGCLGLIEKLPTGFVPDEDQGYFMATIQLPPASSLQRNDEVMRHIEDKMKELDGVEYLIALGGLNLLNGSSSSYSSSMFVVLKPWGERQSPELSINALMQKTRAMFSNYNDAVISVFNPPPIRGMGNAGGFTFELQDRTGQGIGKLAETSQKFMQAAMQRPEIGVIFTSFNAHVPQIKVDVDREKAKTLGVPVQDIFSALQTFLGGYYVNDFNRFGRTYRVMLQAKPEFRRQVDQVGSFYVRAQDGSMIPLSTLTHPQSITGPEYVQHFNLYQTVEINGASAPGYSSGQALDALKEVAAENLPQGYSFAWSGLSFQEIQQGGQAVVAFGLAVLMVVLFLSALYESWLVPWAVILCVPVAIFGAMFGQLLRGLDNNVYAQIGLVMLIGLAAKNAILIVEFAMMRRSQGLTVREAAVDAAHLRFRPILMTSFAFILGVLPLVLASGAGAASRHSLGTSVFAGMLFATVLGTFFIPTLYTSIEWLRGNRDKKGKKNGKDAGADAGTPPATPEASSDASPQAPSDTPEDEPSGA
ncbi:efflux RND transporter permease subunit [Oceanidesulfovibrio marinus]|uniref:Multidrug efflux RND transporter permease subunit n=1 Tax=Oceanidesulfovibrio marinus TaxID=370038 RepID=A0ABX6NIG8_9BACT|nr:multidrug efflux RND transporter permease subunit [Oceanidesulfovibrio marinus]QJT10363.1 multidrug efflux RND transporter permease subunit [Oceanidesulfovibrio marinus]